MASSSYANLHTFGHYKVTIILVNFDNLCILSYTNARQKNGRKTFCRISAISSTQISCTENGQSLDTKPTPFDAPNITSYLLKL